MFSLRFGAIGTPSANGSRQDVIGGLDDGSYLPSTGICTVKSRQVKIKQENRVRNLTDHGASFLEGKSIRPRGRGRCNEREQKWRSGELIIWLENDWRGYSAASSFVSRPRAIICTRSESLVIAMQP